MEMVSGARQVGRQAGRKAELDKGAEWRGVGLRRAEVELRIEGEMEETARWGKGNEKEVEEREWGNGFWENNGRDREMYEWID